MNERDQQIITHFTLAVLMLMFANTTTSDDWATIFTMVAIVNISFIIYHLTKNT